MRRLGGGGRGRLRRPRRVRSVEDLDRAQFADAIAQMQEKLSEKEGVELDSAIARLDHFKSIQHELSSTAMH